jgi:hypothetical protein
VCAREKLRLQALYFESIGLTAVCVLDFTDIIAIFEVMRLTIPAVKPF